MSIYDEFDKLIDIEGLKEDLKEAEKNSGNTTYKDVPYGKYEVAIDKMELKASKKGSPMVSIWFKIVSGEYEGSLLFMNQVITQGFQIHLVDEMLRALTSESKFDIKFESYNQYGNLIMDIFEEISEKYEYALNYNQNKKGYDTFGIEETFVLE